MNCLNKLALPFVNKFGLILILIYVSDSSPLLLDFDDGKPKNSNSPSDVDELLELILRH